MRRPGLLVGLLGLAAVAYISLNSLRTEGPGSRGVPAGERLPAFAVPLALSDLEGDPNVSDRAYVCELAEQGPVVLAFFAEPSELCNDQIDVLDRVARRFPDVRFAAVAIRGSREELRRLVRRRGWRLPVGHDHNGAVANAYAVAICPAITFAARGGEVTATALGALGERALEARIARLSEAGGGASSVRGRP
jgi:hypothetical protein